MRPVTTRFLTELQRSHTAVVRVDVLSYFNPLAPVTSSGLPGVTGGTVTLDQTAAVRGRLDLELVDDGTLDLIPTSYDDQLTVYGNELQVWRGVRYADGVEELVSLGIFRIDSVDVEDSTEGVRIRVSALDRAHRIVEARFEAPYQIASGTNYVTALTDVLRSGYPGITLDLGSTGLTTPLLIAEEGADRWAFAQDMATALGCRLYFDGDGDCVMRTVSNGASATVTLAEGDDGVLVSAARGSKREGSYNRVIAAGENTGQGAPVRGVATDDSPTSPTRYGGPYGNVPMFYSSPLLTTDAQAAAAAGSLLAKQLGSTQSVGFGTIINPALEPDDVARIIRAASGLDELHIIDQVTIPLAIADAATMTGTTRATSGLL